MCIIQSMYTDVYIDVYTLPIPNPNSPWTVTGLSIYQHSPSSSSIDINHAHLVTNASNSTSSQCFSEDISQLISCSDIFRLFWSELTIYFNMLSHFMKYKLSLVVIWMASSLSHHKFISLDWANAISSSRLRIYISSQVVDAISTIFRLCTWTRDDILFLTFPRN